MATAKKKATASKKATVAKSKTTESAAKPKAAAESTAAPTPKAAEKPTEMPNVTETIKAVAAETEKVTAIVDEAVAASKQTVEAVTSANREAVETVVKAGNDAAKKSYEEAVSKGHEQVETVVKANIDAIRGIEDIIAANEAAFEASIRVNTTLAKGVESIAAELLGFAKTTTEQQADAIRKLMTASSPAAFFAIQADFAKASFIANLDEGRKLSAMGRDLVDATTKPVAEQVWETTETLVTARAA